MKRRGRSISISSPVGFHNVPPWYGLPHSSSLFLSQAPVLREKPPNQCSVSCNGSDALQVKPVTRAVCPPRVAESRTTCKFLEGLPFLIGEERVLVRQLGHTCADAKCMAGFNSKLWTDASQNFRSPEQPAEWTFYFYFFYPFPFFLGLLPLSSSTTASSPPLFSPALSSLLPSLHFTNPSTSPK
ncbi:hypothetical protein LZ32DRAFT_336971 [Colletotrichum eremochloae]|nr:hypothetical protein LZ32DRAFT_336971 [Colletotrichum eremochloae]